MLACVVANTESTEITVAHKQLLYPNTVTIRTYTNHSHGARQSVLNSGAAIKGITV